MVGDRWRLEEPIRCKPYVSVEVDGRSGRIWFCRLHLYSPGLSPDTLLQEWYASVYRWLAILGKFLPFCVSLFARESQGTYFDPCGFRFVNPDIMMRFLGGGVDHQQKGRENETLSSGKDGSSILCQMVANYSLTIGTVI